jgi:hypothetical protein
MGNKIAQVEYSSDSSGVDNFYPLRPGSLYERNSGSNGNPIKYIRKAGAFLVVPVPTSSTGQLRVTYAHKLQKIDLRRGTVASVTLTTSVVSALTMEVSSDVVDSTELDKFTRISIVNEEGVVQMRNIKVTNIDASTGVVTVDSSFAFESGETITAGDYVVAGDYSSTHVQLDEMVERYLIAYCTLKILHRDSAVADMQSQLMLVTEMENDILDAYAEISDDIMEIPDIISYDDDWSF